jgi:hypothetical protein
MNKYNIDFFYMHLFPFTPSPLRLNIFRLFMTQLYRYTPEIFFFSTATLNINTGTPSDELDK